MTKRTKAPRKPVRRTKDRAPHRCGTSSERAERARATRLVETCRIATGVRRR